MKSIYDLAKENYDTTEEIRALYNTFSQKKSVGIKKKNYLTPFGDIFPEDIPFTLSFEEYVDQYLFLKWKDNAGIDGVERYKNKIGITNIISDSISEEQAIHTLQYIYTMMRLIADIEPSEIKRDYNHDLYGHIINNIKIISSKFNMTIRNVGTQKCRIYPINKNLENAVSHAPNEKTAIDMIEYTQIGNKGNLEAKKQILKKLADAFEPERQILEKSGYYSLATDLGFLFNSIDIRHNNKKGPKEYNFVNEMSIPTLEKWYNYTYDLYLLAEIAADSLKMKNSLQLLKEKARSEDVMKKSEKKKAKKESKETST